MQSFSYRPGSLRAPVPLELGVTGMRHRGGPLRPWGTLVGLQLQRWQSGGILGVKFSLRFEEGTEVIAAGYRPEEPEVPRAFEILHQDEGLLVIDKPPGLPVQGGSGQTRHVDGLAEALKFGRDEKPRLVHRLDKDTSGVMVAAKTEQAHNHLAAQFAVLVAGVAALEGRKLLY